MINNSLANRTDLIYSIPQKITETSLTTELQNIAPAMAEELLNKFGEEKVEQLLQQQLTALITVSAQTSIADYQQSDEELALRTVLTSQQEGLLNNENSDKLLARLTQSVTDIRGAYANTSDILSSLGQLGHQQKSFLASSEQRVERALGAYMGAMPHFQNEKDDNYRFELSVETKEGDIINITFNSSQGYSDGSGDITDGFSLSYQVDGNLSEAEHKALTEVLAGVGEMADEFFTLGQVDMNLDFLSAFNHQQLSGFDVSFSTSEDQVIAGVENTLDLSYQVDQDTQQQELVFKSKAGATEIDFSLDMSTFGGQDMQQMQQYLAALDKNLEESRHNSNGEDKSSAFGKKGDASMQQGFALFKGAFESMSSAAERYSNIESIAAQQFSNGRDMAADLVDNMITNDPRYQGLGSETKNTLGAGVSKLADFEATFSFSMEQGRLRPKSTVELNQETEQYQSGELTGVSQNKSVASHFDYQSTRPDYYDTAENYTIGTAIKNQQLVGLDQLHDTNTDKETYRFDPETEQYELMMKRTEKVTNESNIRLINKIWLETNENSHTMDKKERVEERGKPDEFKKTNQHSYNKLITLIGDLDKLSENKDFKRDYLVDLDRVNFFMDKKV